MSPKHSTANNNSTCILLVDDDPNMQRMVSLFLNKARFNLDIVGNGRKALEQLEKKEYNLVISDMQMPLMDGSELARNIRAKKIKTPIILISAYNAVNMPEEIDTSYFAAVIFKPFDSANLITTINEVLGIKTK